MKRLLLALVLGAWTCSAQAAGVQFFTDKATFDAATNSSLIDFEGIAGGGSVVTLPAHVIDGVTFTTTPDQQGPTATVCGSTACSGLPHDSAFFVADRGTRMIIDLTTLGSGVRAVGGIFGDIDSSGNSGNFTVYGTSDVIDSRSVPVNDLGAGLVHTFLGWTVSGGDFITRIEFDLAPKGDGDSFFAGLDDFQYGTAVPIPAAAWLFGSALGLLGWMRRR